MIVTVAVRCRRDAESKQAVAEAQAANIRVRMVTGDDVTTGAAIAEQVGIPGTAILGAEFAALPEHVRLARIDERPSHEHRAAFDASPTRPAPWQPASFRQRVAGQHQPACPGGTPPAS